LNQNSEPRRVLAVLKERDSLERAVEGLQSQGIDRSQINLIATDSGANAGLDQPTQPLDRAEIGDAIGVIAGGPALLAAFVAAGLTAASGGALAGIAVASLAAGAGVGGLGALFAKQFGERFGGRLDATLASGGIALWVTEVEPGDLAAARAVLAEHAADVEEFGGEDRAG
jgi:hypothetical protein